MTEKQLLNNDEKIDQIVSYLKLNSHMIDVIYSKLFDLNINENDKKNDLIYKCIMPFASYLHCNYDEKQLERIHDSFDRSLRYKDI